MSQKAYQKKGDQSADDDKAVVGDFWKVTRILRFDVQKDSNYQDVEKHHGQRA